MLKLRPYQQDILRKVQTALATDGQHRSIDLTVRRRWVLSPGPSRLTLPRPVVARAFPRESVQHLRTVTPEKPSGHLLRSPPL